MIAETAAPAVLHDVPTLETVLGSVFDAADYFGADDDQVTKTTFHLARKALTLKPGAQYKDLAPYLKRFCNKHEADSDKHQDELCYILIQGIKLAAPIIETAERLTANPWRVELPDTIAQTDGYKALATACYYLRKRADGGAFFLGSRKAGELIGESKSSAAKKLLVLRSAGVIQRVKKAYDEWVTDDETGEQKLVRKAAEYKFTLDDNSQCWTQGTQGSQGTQSPRETTNPNQTQSDPDPELESIDLGLCRGTDWDPELHDDLETIQDDEHDPAMDTILERAESSKRVVGGKNAAQEEQELRATATATAALEEKIRATAPDPKGVPGPFAQALESFVQTAKAMEAKQQTAPDDRKLNLCEWCGKKPRHEHSTEEIEACWATRNAWRDEQTSRETQAAKGVLPSERCRAELMANASKGKSLDDVKRDAAPILGKFLGRNGESDVKRIYDMIQKYKSTAVISATYKIIDEGKGSIKSPIGVLEWRLKEAGLAVAV